MRRHGNPEGIAQGRDALHLGEAAGVADIGLRNGDRFGLQQVQEFVAVDEAFARRDRHAGGARHARGAAPVLGLAGLLDEEGTVGLQYLRILDGHGRGGAAVEVHHDVHVRAAALARCGHQRLRLAQRGHAIERGGPADGQDLDGGEAVGARLCGLLAEGVGGGGLVDGVGIAAAQMVVHPQPLAAQPAKQLPQRDAEMLGLDVVQRLVDA